MKSMARPASAAIALAAVVLLATPAMAVDGMAIEAGGGDGTDMGRVALQWDWNRRWFQGKEWHLGGYWDLGVGHWWRKVLPGQNRSITEIGLTPVFRLQRNDREGPYLEFAVGFHWLSDTSIGGKRLSTQFQFGDHVGLGYRFGAKRAYDLSYRYQHLSNAGIKKPNDGVDFHQIRLQYRF
jgi:opacity protein-like surface antigen